MAKLSLFILVLLWRFPVFSYPDFISYRYKSCVSCHYNSHGNGPLTDYGRALFSQEIAARTFWIPKDKTDEQIAESSSGFVPGHELPAWLRPSIKYRGLMLVTNPGSSDSKNRFIHMQRDVNLVFAMGESGRTVAVVNYGLLAIPESDYYRNGSNISGISREHYFRFYASDNLLIATGLMDKAYGLRIADHTSYSRGSVGVGQDDQVHGALLHWLEEAWEASVHLFAGNLSAAPDAQKKGGALMFEKSIGENDRLGTSILVERNNSIESRRLAIHNRYGFPEAHGSSILFEFGVKQDQKIGVATAPIGTYGIIQSVINFARGYNFLTTIERNQLESKFASPELQRWTFGFLMFPLQRTEVRVTAVQFKNFSPAVVEKDHWQLQGQVHVSW